MAQSLVVNVNAARMACEFLLLRYVPDVVKGEFVNVGVVLREAGGAQAQVRFTRDWRRVRCLDAEADVELLEGLEQEIAERLRVGVSVREPKAVLEVLEETLSNCVQLSAPRATLAENLATEMEQLMRMYVEPLSSGRMRSKGTRASSGRPAIERAMRREFERVGVWGMMRKRIAAAAYTRAGDPLRIDCGYRPNGVVKMFQAVSLGGDVEAAKVLAYSAPQLREGVGRVEGAGLEMTAVVEALRTVAPAEAEEAEERYRFGVETMERQEIRVVTVNDLARAALTAQRELGL